MLRSWSQPEPCPKEGGKARKGLVQSGGNSVPGSHEPFLWAVPSSPPSCLFSVGVVGGRGRPGWGLTRKVWGQPGSDLATLGPASPSRGSWQERPHAHSLNQRLQGGAQEPPSSLGDSDAASGSRTTALEYGSPRWLHIRVIGRV